MAKVISINLSSREKTYTAKVNISQEGQPMKLVDQERKYRELEITILKSLFNIGGMISKKPKDIMLCIDCISQLDNLEGDSINFTKDDIALLEKAFESTAGKNANGEYNRPMEWNRAVDLWKQIANPTEIDV